METCDQCGNNRIDTVERENGEYICDDCMQFEEIDQQVRLYEMNRE